MRGLPPPLRGGNSSSKESPVLPIPSYPALCREDTTSWNHGRPGTHHKPEGNHSRAQFGKWPQEALRRSFWSMSGLSPGNGPRRRPEGYFGNLSAARSQEEAPGIQKRQSVLKIALGSLNTKSGPVRPGSRKEHPGLKNDNPKFKLYGNRYRPHPGRSGPDRCRMLLVG